MKSSLAYLLLFISLAVSGQERKMLKGKVSIGGDEGAGLFVINNKTGEETKTGTDGGFSIMARPGDALAVYSDRTEVREFAISENAFKESPYTVSVEYKTYDLEEVEINKDRKVNSEALGIVSKDQKKYTPAERKLKTASEIKPWGIFDGGMALDPLLNAINGRTKMLKGALSTERKELAIQKINGIYTEDEIVSEFSIPKEYVNGFLFYVVEDKDLAAALKADNTDRVQFLMGPLAQKYLEIIKEE